MIVSIILFVLFSFISYRLIGSENLRGKALIASVLSLVFSSAAYYVFHVRNAPPETRFFHFDHYTFLYFITLVVVSMGFSLILEMMSPQEGKPEDAPGLIPRLRYFVSSRLRYLNLLAVVSRNGLLKSTLRPGREMRSREMAVAFRNTLEKAGGLFVKFGQFLSTRSDLFPAEFREELSRLQEEVEPVPVEQIREVIRTQLGRPVDEIFREFDDEPLAAASIAQVHRAQLKNGQEVIVKVLRPALRKQLAVDVHILTSFADLLARRTAWARKIGIRSLTEGFIQGLHEETDFSYELGNLRQMKKEESGSVYIPTAFKEYSTTDVLVMEYVDGVSLSKAARRLQNNPAARAELANELFQEMLEQIFDKGLFHGDPHPGNILILKNGRPAFIDFGAVGRLSEIQRNGFKWLLIGIIRKNADSMVTGVKSLVENSNDIDSRKLEQSLSQFLAEHSFEGDILDEMGKDLFEIMGRYRLQFYPDVAAAFRSLIILQGSLQTVDPNFNLAAVLDSYMKTIMNFSSLKQTALDSMEDDLLNLIPMLKALPKRIEGITRQAEDGRFTIRMSLFSDEANVRFMNSIVSLFFTGLVGFAFGALALGALFLAQSEEPGGYSFLDVFGYSGLGLGVTMLIRVAIQSMRRRQ
ncbi:ABC1 kinase family protein [Bhargavaea ullalensis]|uniref:Ubiquinone biosynthesis protein n=1 Tax=Bhargavaea ullalensis TaxID=1265685 RepID=A0ABV2GD25_9BACL